MFCCYISLCTVEENVFFLDIDRHQGVVVYVFVYTLFFVFFHVSRHKAFCLPSA